MEIERKWLLNRKNLPFDPAKVTGKKIEQYYLCFTPTIRIRSVDDRQFILTVKGKSADGGLSREETELELDRETYEHLKTKAEGTPILKTRYVIPKGKYRLEFDLFEKPFENLTYLEIEFESADEARDYPNPEYAEKDVTQDDRYKNAFLAKYGKI